MTVADLIEKLKELPQDMEVRVCSDYSGIQPLDKAGVYEDALLKATFVLLES